MLRRVADGENILVIVMKADLSLKVINGKKLLCIKPEALTEEDHPRWFLEAFPDCRQALGRGDGKRGYTLALPLRDLECDTRTPDPDEGLSRPK